MSSALPSHVLEQLELQHPERLGLRSRRIAGFDAAHFWIMRSLAFAEQAALPRHELLRIRAQAIRINIGREKWNQAAWIAHESQQILAHITKEAKEAKEAKAAAAAAAKTSSSPSASSSTSAAATAFFAFTASAAAAFAAVGAQPATPCGDLSWVLEQQASLHALRAEIEQRQYRYASAGKHWHRALLALGAQEALQRRTLKPAAAAATTSATPTAAATAAAAAEATAIATAQLEPTRNYARSLLPLMTQLSHCVLRDGMMGLPPSVSAAASCAPAASDGHHAAHLAEHVQVHSEKALELASASIRQACMCAHRDNMLCMRCMPKNIALQLATIQAQTKAQAQAQAQARAAEAEANKKNKKMATASSAEAAAATSLFDAAKPLPHAHELESRISGAIGTGAEAGAGVGAGAGAHITDEIDLLLAASLLAASRYEFFLQPLPPSQQQDEETAPLPSAPTATAPKATAVAGIVPILGDPALQAHLSKQQQRQKRQRRQPSPKPFAVTFDLPSDAPAAATPAAAVAAADSSSSSASDTTAPLRAAATAAWNAAQQRWTSASSTAAAAFGIATPASTTAAAASSSSSSSLSSAAPPSSLSPAELLELQLNVARSYEQLSRSLRARGDPRRARVASALGQQGTDTEWIRDTLPPESLEQH